MKSTKAVQSSRKAWCSFLTFTVLFGSTGVSRILNMLSSPDSNTEWDIETESDKYLAPTAVPPACGCSKSQLLELERQLLISNPHSPLRGREIRCPRADWLANFYKEEADIGSKNFVGISVGCNKGHDAIHTARMGLSSLDFDVSKWMDTGKWKGFACRAQNDVFDIVHPRRNGEMHCIEPMPSTFSALANASNKLNLESKGWVLNHAAIASSKGIANFPSNSNAGTEDLGLTYCKHPKHKNKPYCNDVPVPVYSLEQYVDKFVKTNGPINILEIDVEGWDFDVLFGASSVLDRTHYLEFEYHIAGNWGRLHLTDAVRLLDGKGFTCYWAGRGRLWQITECYLDFYDNWHNWSNVACVHRSQNRLSSRMEQVFNQTLNSP